MKLTPVLLDQEQLEKFKKEGNFFLNLTSSGVNKFYQNRYRLLSALEKVDEVYYYVYLYEDENGNKDYFRALWPNKNSKYYGHIVINRVFRSFFHPEEPHSKIVDVVDRRVTHVDNLVDLTSLETYQGEKVSDICQNLMDQHISVVVNNIDLLSHWTLDKFPDTWWKPISQLNIEERKWKTLPPQLRFSRHSKYQTRGGNLFIETLKSVNDLPLFTFQPEDIVIIAGPYRGLYLWSLPKLYSNIADPTEFKFAVEVFGDFRVWQTVQELETVKPYIEDLRENLKYMMKSKIVAKMMEVVEEGGPKAFQAAKWLSEQGWNVDAKLPENKKKVGRPKKEVEEDTTLSKDEEELINLFKEKIKVPV